MKRLYLLFILILGLVPLSVSAQSQSLTTIFAADNSFAGNMFDVSVSEDVCINSFDVNLVSPATTETMTIYYKVGTYAGSETNAGAWTTLGSAVVTPQGLDTPTPVPVGGLTLSPGTVYGFYVSLSTYTGDGDAIAYTNGGPNVYSNGVMTLTTAVGNFFPEFSGTFFPRQWNGTIHYTLGDCSGGIVPPSGPQPAFVDGRINNYDVAAPIAVYPHFVNGEVGLIIYDVNGVELLVVSAAQLADAPDNPSSNLLIAESNNVELYRLAGGGWQINAPQYNGKTYVLLFEEPYVNIGYTSYEE